MTTDAEFTDALRRNDWNKVERMLAEMTGWQRVAYAEMAANEKSWSAALAKREGDGNRPAQ